MDLLFVPGTYRLLLLPCPRALLTLVTKLDCCSANCCNPVRNLDGGDFFVTVVCSHALFKSYEKKKQYERVERERG